MSQLLNQVADVKIDPNGTFKYILITVTDNSDKSKKQIVRGYASETWHGKYHNEPFWTHIITNLSQ